MLFINRIVLIGLLGVGITAATTAQAENQLFEGEWFTFSFGNICDRNDLRTITENGDGVCALTQNERTSSASPSFAYGGFGIPEGLFCNGKWPRCPFQSTPTTPTMLGGKGDFHPLGGTQVETANGGSPDFCAPWYNWGGGTTGNITLMNKTATMRPAKGDTIFDTIVTGQKGTSKLRPVPPLYRNYKFFTTTSNAALPNRYNCLSTSTTLMGYPGQLTENESNDYGLGGARGGLVQVGHPLAGTWTAHTTTGGGFTFPAAPFKGNGGVRVDGLVADFPNLFPYLYSYTYATLRNDAGVFGPGAGPGDFSVTFAQGANAVATARNKAGAAKFGGTMTLLGSYNTKVCYFRNDGCSLGRQDWRYDAVGASGYYSGGVLTQGYIAQFVAYYYHTGLMQKSTINVDGSRFPWTTGSITVRATGRGPHKTVHTAMGYDNRDTVTHKGTIQLVTPVITRWNQVAANFETGGVGIFRIKFVPEPQTWALLIAGVSLLGVGYRMRGR